MAKPQLPKSIYVTMDMNTNDPKDLHAWRTLFEAAEDDEQTVGMYELKATKRIRKVVEVIP